MATYSDPCVHCGLPIPPEDLVVDRIGDTDLPFCCRGCAGAYRIITGAGLGDFYRSRRWDEPGTPEGVFDTAYTDEYLAGFATPCRGGAEIDVLVEGIRCASCIWVVERILTDLSGVAEARLNFATHRARIRFDPELTSPRAIFAALSAIGYLPRPYTADEIEQASRRERRALLFRFGTAAFLSMQLMGYSIALYAGYFQGMEEQSRRLLQFLSWVVATPVVFYGGSPFFAGAVRNLMYGVPGMDLLIALGVGSAYGYSVYGFFAGGEVYFDTAAMVVTLVLTGRLFELAARRRASSGIDRLLRLAPDVAHKMDGDTVEEVGSATLRPGDVLLVRPGERFPTDGEIVAGETEVDEAPVTGEATPVRRGPGASVNSGTVNLTSSVRLRVTATPADSFVGRVARLVEEAQTRKAPIQRLADRAAAVFVPLVVFVAGGTWIYWTLQGAGTSPAVLAAVSVLVVACPCALGLATPTAVLVATSAAARRGVLFRGGDVVEALAEVRVVAFDKTGTLTEGRPRVVEVRPTSRPESELLELAAQAEVGSAHPLARAVLEEARARGLRVAPCERVSVRPGRGVELETEAGTLRVGSRSFLAAHGIGLPDDRFDPGMTELHVAIGPEHCGTILADDAVRSGAAETVRAFKELGLRTVLLTGDGKAAGERVGQRLRLEEVQAEQTPEDKAAYVRARKAAGEPVLMVGDGVNDAPALSAATVGCALAGGTDIAMETSSLVLTRPDLSRLPTAVDLARRTLRVIRQNLCWAFGYNLVAIPLAAAGKLAPVYAAGAMAVSSVCVLGNSLRLARTADAQARGLSSRAAKVRGGLA